MSDIKTSTPKAYYKFPERRAEKEIDLVALFFEIHRHFVSLILAAIVGAILGAMLGDYKFQKNYEYVPSEYELARINSAHTLYNKYINSVNGRADSYITSLDTSRQDYVQETMTYYIHMDEDSYINMASTIFNIQNNSKYLTELQNITGFQGSKSTLSTILNPSFQIVSNEKNSITLSTEGGVENDSKEDYAILTVTISYLTQDQCALFKSYVDGWLSDAVAANKGFYKGLSVTKISDNTMELGSGFISNAISSLNEQEVAYITEYHDLVNSFSADEKFYYDNLYSDSEEKGSSKASMIKYGFLCGVGAAFVLAAFYAFLFIISGVVTSERDIEEEYGITILGRVRVRQTKKGLNGRFLNKIYGSTIDDCDPQYIVDVLKLYNESTTYMVATDADLYHIKENAVNVFIDAMADLSETPVACGSLVTDARMVRHAKKGAGVCIIVIPGVTKDHELRAQLSVCNKHKINVQGAIILR